MFPQLQCQSHGGTHTINTGVFMFVSPLFIQIGGIDVRGVENYSCTRSVFPILPSAIQCIRNDCIRISGYIHMFYEWHVYSYVYYITQRFISSSYTHQIARAYPFLSRGPDCDLHLPTYTHQIARAYSFLLRGPDCEHSCTDVLHLSPGHFIYWRRR